MSIQPPPRLASEDVIINAPMSYTGSAQRIIRLRRRAQSNQALVAVTAAAVLLIALAWVVITAWYLIWGIWLVPYRLLRRGARKRKAEAMRHRELMGTIQGSAAASAAAFVATSAMPAVSVSSQTIEVPAATQRIGDAERDQMLEELRSHLLAGRLTAEEFEERLGLAHIAKTWGDLELVRADLPPVPRLNLP